MKLSDIKIKKALPKDKSYKLMDGMGLYLEVKPIGKRTVNGSKLWRFKYQFKGKEKKLCIGAYPNITLAHARELRNEARAKIIAGVDPCQEKKLKKLTNKKELENTFEKIAREWYEVQLSKWSEAYAHNIFRGIEKDVFGYLGSVPVSEINPPMLLSVLKKMEARGVSETVHRVLSTCTRVFNYAIAAGIVDTNPCLALGEAIKPIKLAQHFAALTDPKEIGGLLRAIEAYPGMLLTKYALKLTPYVFVRPGELRQAKWSEFEFQIKDEHTGMLVTLSVHELSREAVNRKKQWAEMNLASASWYIPAIKMKMRKDHMVPLAKQVLALLESIYKISGDNKYDYLFPSIKDPDRPMSNGTVGGALKRLGYTSNEVVPHGFRTTASTRLNEQSWNKDWIEMQLSHVDGVGTRKIYNRAEYKNSRAEMMQHYADYLDFLRNSV